MRTPKTGMLLGAIPTSKDLYRGIIIRKTMNGTLRLRYKYRLLQLQITARLPESFAVHSPKIL